jgi:hypothetical protein
MDVVCQRSPLLRGTDMKVWCRNPWMRGSDNDCGVVQKPMD